MKKILMAIGLPFSGKSKLMREYIDKGYEIISRDDLLEKLIESDEFKNRAAEKIKELNIDPKNNSANFLVKNDIAIEMLAAIVRDIVLNSEHNNFFYDGTNIQKKVRASILKLKEDGVQVDGVYLKVPVEEIERRGREIMEKGNRKGEFNEQAYNQLKYIIRMLEEPKLEEGFSSLTVHDFVQENKRELQFH